MNKIAYFTILIFVLISSSLLGQVSHQEWNMLLSKHVSKAGQVNYVGFSAERVKLDAYLGKLASNHPANQSKNIEMAYWINAYNAFTVKLIVDNYPLNSIKDLDDPWNRKFIVIQGKKYSLNDIEHEILRKKFNDPRIHFALNCASYSCPILQNHAFFPDKLNQQLDNAARQFINDPKRNILKEDYLQLSALFDWYKEDFTQNGSLVDYVKKYANKPIDQNAKVTFLEYDWRLNK